MTIPRRAAYYSDTAVFKDWTPAVCWVRMAKPDRKRMDEALLRERLGLDDDWPDRDENGVARLPATLPQFIQQKPSKQLCEVETAVNRLVAAGCRRQVLYFCLKELSPAAEQSRRERKLVRVGEELRMEPLKWAPKEDLKVVANQAKRTLKLIRKHRRELLLAYDATKPSIPVDFFEECADAGSEVLSAVPNLLALVRDLANSYVAPFETTLLKSKGLLYLAVYVYEYAKAERLESALRRAEREHPGRKQRFRMRDAIPEQALATIASACTGHHWAPSDLKAKLKGFAKDHPVLHKKMETKIAALHDAAAE